MHYLNSVVGDIGYRLGYGVAQNEQTQNPIPTTKAETFQQPHSQENVLSRNEKIVEIACEILDPQEIYESIGKEYTQEEKDALLSAINHFKDKEILSQVKSLIKKLTVNEDSLFQVLKRTNFILGLNKEEAVLISSILNGSDLTSNQIRKIINISDNDKGHVSFIEGHRVVRFRLLESLMGENDAFSKYDELSAKMDETLSKDKNTRIKELKLINALLKYNEVSYVLSGFKSISDVDCNRVICYSDSGIATKIAPTLKNNEFELIFIQTEETQPTL